jgi:hypothetical protein
MGGRNRIHIGARKGDIADIEARHFLIPLSR